MERVGTSTGGGAGEGWMNVGREGHMYILRLLLGILEWTRAYTTIVLPCTYTSLSFVQFFVYSVQVKTVVLFYAAADHPMKVLDWIRPPAPPPDRRSHPRSFALPVTLF